MNSFKINITTQTKPLDFNMKEIIEYRDLIGLFVKRDFIAQYKQTILGPLWAVIQPLLTTVVLTVVFGKIAGLTTSDIPGVYLPSILFYLSGTLCWNYVSRTISDTSKAFINNRSIMGKVYYPRVITPISTALSNLIPFFIQLMMLGAIIIYYLLKSEVFICLGIRILLFPILVLQMMILSVGVGIIISSLTTKYRDLALLTGFGLQLWQYASPVAYGFDLVPSNMQRIYMLNPVSVIITAFRYIVFGNGFFSVSYYVISWLISALLFFIGLFLFNKVERVFMDTV